MEDKYARIICSVKGPQFLTKTQYESFVANLYRDWRCPVCAGYLCSFDAAYFEKAHQACNGSPERDYPLTVLLFAKNPGQQDLFEEMHKLEADRQDLRSMLQRMYNEYKIFMTSCNPTDKPLLEACQATLNRIK